jgi:hypothetical protein
MGTQNKTVGEMEMRKVGASMKGEKKVKQDLKFGNFPLIWCDEGHRLLRQGHRSSLSSLLPFKTCPFKKNGNSRYPPCLSPL